MGNQVKFRADLRLDDEVSDYHIIFGALFAMNQALLQHIIIIFKTMLYDVHLKAILVIVYRLETVITFLANKFIFVNFAVSYLSIMAIIVY